MGFTRAEALAAIAFSFLVGLVAGLVAGITGALVGEPISAALAWGGTTFLGMATFSMVAAGFYLGARKTPRAGSGRS